MYHYQTATKASGFSHWDESRAAAGEKYFPLLFSSKRRYE